jgi:hypothetical protein
MGCFRVIKIQYNSSTRDKITKNESKADILHKISKDVVCIFQTFRFFSEIEAK